MRQDKVRLLLGVALVASLGVNAGLSAALQAEQQDEYARGYERGFQNAAEIGLRAEVKAYWADRKSIRVDLPCYEDEVIIWNGETNRHDICWALSGD